jgi:hypothetical protein
MKKIAFWSFWALASVIFSAATFASEEGTRHITGEGIDLYFMNDKLFGHVYGHPLWAIYNCRSDIKGEIDVNGTYHVFQMVYHREGDRMVTGTVGDRYVGMGAIERTPQGFAYHVFIREKEYTFSIKYETLEDEHLVNSVIEGDMGNGKKIKMTVDGHLCPFATSGIICIAAGSLLMM